MLTIRDLLEKIALEHDVFSCNVGDWDESYGFVYFRDGQLVREYSMEPIDFGPTCSVARDVGEPLAGESDAMKHTDELEIVLSIAMSLGIDLLHDRRLIRAYI